MQLGDEEQHTEQAVDDGGDALQRLGGDAHDLDELAAAAGVLDQPDGGKMPSGVAMSSAKAVISTVLMSAGVSETFSELYSHAKSSGLRLGIPMTRM